LLINYNPFLLDNLDNIVNINAIIFLGYIINNQEFSFVQQQLKVHSFRKSLTYAFNSLIFKIIQGYLNQFLQTSRTVCSRSAIMYKNEAIPTTLESKSSGSIMLILSPAE